MSRMGKPPMHPCTGHTTYVCTCCYGRDLFFNVKKLHLVYVYYLVYMYIHVGTCTYVYIHRMYMYIHAAVLNFETSYHTGLPTVYNIYCIYTCTYVHVHVHAVMFKFQSY